MDRRTLTVDIRALWVWADQSIQIPRFEFVSLRGESCEVSDSVVTGACGKDVVEYQSGERSKTSGTASTNRHPFWIDVAAFGEKARSVNAIVDVHDSPVAV